MNHINQVTLTGTIVNLTPVLLLQTSRRSGSIQPSDIIPCALSAHLLTAPRGDGQERVQDKKQDKKQEEPTTTSCKTEGKKSAVPATLPCKDTGGRVIHLRVGDTITVEGYYESNRSNGHLSTYVRVESVTPAQTPAQSIRDSDESNTATVRGYVARLGEPRRTRTGYTVTDVLVATCTPSGDPAYLPTAIFANARYPRLRLHGPVTLTGRLQQRRYTASDGRRGVCWELVPWWVGNTEHSDADTWRLRAVSKHYVCEEQTAQHCNTNMSEGTLDDWVTEPLDDSWLSEEEL